MLENKIVPKNGNILQNVTISIKSLGSDFSVEAAPLWISAQAI